MMVASLKSALGHPMTPASVSQRLMVLEQLTGQLMLLEQVAENS